MPETALNAATNRFLNMDETTQIPDLEGDQDADRIAHELNGAAALSIQLTSTSRFLLVIVPFCNGLH